jgi:energy-coupling factor transport system ATP-binding protein
MKGSAPRLIRGTLTGAASVCGKSVADTKVVEFAAEVGMVFQDPDPQIVNSRVRDEVCFGLENPCRPTSEILTRQSEALGFVGLSGFGDRSISELSGGQKQRVSIAAVLAAQPRLLVLDEPTANLDPAGMAEVFSVLARLNAEHGTTIVMVEHRVDELAHKVSRVVMMDRGGIVFDGTPRAAFSSQRAVHSEKADVVPIASWVPGVSEMALVVAAVSHRALGVDEVPLFVEDAEALCRTWSFPAGVAAPENAPLSAESRQTKPLLSIKGLNFGYDRPSPILKGVNLEIASNSMIALLGQNASGKTTLARLLLGINPRRIEVGISWS